MHIFYKKGIPISYVDINYMTASISAKFGAYTGYDLHVAMVEGRVSIFDI
jgi:hypothetical protein